MLTIDRRDCKIGVIGTRREFHGEDPVAAMDIPISAIHLTKREIEALFDDSTVWDNWFNLRTGDKLPEPAPWVKLLRAFSFADKFKDSTAIIYVGLNNDMVRLMNIKLAKIKLEPLVGGLTAIQLTIQCAPDMHEAVALFDHMEHSAYIAIEIGERDDATAVKTQPELPMTMEESAANATH